MHRALPLLLLAGCSPVVVDFGDKPGGPRDDSGPVGVGAIEVSPGWGDLGLVLTGDRAEITFTVSNTGDGPVALASDMGSSNAGWSYTLVATDLAPGETAELVVTLEPNTWGDAEATLTVSDTAGSGSTVNVRVSAVVQEDADDDGVGSLESGGTDCDDADPGAFPGAPDPWYDGVDGDCAGDDDFDQDADGARLESDCDDQDADVYPGAPDTWYDDVDSDCAGDDDFDQDADGAQVGVDCDDLDAAVFPGAEETWYDGRDSDCAGDDDFDQDADTFPVEADCDDLDAAVHPGAADAWYDGVDSNCRGDDDYDQDLDGVDWPDDCDDTEPTVGAPTTEAWNGLDDDCDGRIDELPVSAVASGELYGGLTNLGLGAAGTLSLGGDVDGDGTDDLIAVSAGISGGAGWLVNGASAVAAAGTISFYDRATFTGDTSYVLRSVQGPMVDLTGDATVDVLVNTWSTYVGGAPYLDGDAATGTVAITSSSAYDGYFIGDSMYDVQRWAVAGDVNGDGVADVVTGTMLDNYGSSAFYTGNVTVYAGGDFVGTYDPDDATDQVHGASGSDYLGTALALGDLTGDAYVDIVAGAAGSDAGAANSGAVYVFLGSASMAWANDRADVAAYARIAGVSADQALGEDPLPTPADVDGDGAADVAIGSSEAGEAYVFTGMVGRAGTLDVGDADTTWTGAVGFATALALADLDDDGLADLAVGASGDDTAAVDAGAVFLFHGGALDPTMSEADADAAFYGLAAGDALGSGLAAGGDVDADGVADLLVGATGADSGASNGGVVYVVRGR